jgi:hypothetical protein
VELYPYSPCVPLCQVQAQRYLFVMNDCSVGLPHVLYLQLLEVFQIPTTWKLLGNQWSVQSTLGIIRCRRKKYGHQEVCAIHNTHLWEIVILLTVYEDRKLEVCDRTRHLYRPAV